ncbi:hypothetical protein BGX26_006930 [Mortierella sp. AD094]|nr:hypothetical protein BGX26_006930 [Mortierella sp. AD094]
MNPSNGITEANVEDMSNAELFQYLFKAELGADLPESITDTLLHDVSSPSSSTASTVAHSPYTSLSSPSPSSNESSPTTSTLSYNSPPPYSQTDVQSQQQQQQQQVQLFQPLLQLQPITAATTSPSSYPTLLPSTMFSYRQLSPDMPPSMPSQPSLSNQADTSIANNHFLSLAQTATATASSSSSPSTPSTSTMMPPDQMSIWMQRFQQLQQLQQLHRQQQQEQQQHLISPLFATPQGQLSGRPESSSPSFTSGAKAESNVIYPSPPMKDDMSMDSDSDDNPSREDNNESDLLKPSASELKKMTSKERRQLRNKLSARNFRVRRKEYIGSLENQVKEARREASELQKKLAQSELNCQLLRQELETARLSQTLFNDGRMSKEHANLLASLLNPNTESFPTTTSSDSALSSIQLQQQQQQKELMDSINDNNMTILNNSLTVAQPPCAASTMNVSHGSLQPFVPFDGNWELIINRAEMVVDPALDPKDVQSKEAVYHDLLARYEAAKHEAEVDEQMRTELKAYHEQKLSQTYIVMPKDDAMLAASNKASQDTLILQTMVYMMMIHLTRSLFEAATLSKTQLVNVYQTMDEPLRSKMGQEQQEPQQCKFREWRESWMRKYWPSFYNNRQRVCELLKNGLCPSTTTSSEVDVDETVRKMEEGVKDKTIEPQVSPICVWLRNCLGSWLPCHEHIASEERKALLPESSLEATA